MVDALGEVARKTCLLITELSAAAYTMLSRTATNVVGQVCAMEIHPAVIVANMPSSALIVVGTVNLTPRLSVCAGMVPTGPASCYAWTEVRIAPYFV
jgi:hypothetical protein